MNPFFSAERDKPSEKIPPRSYGKIEHFEVSDGGRTALFAIDVVDASWFDNQDPFDLNLFAVHVRMQRKRVIAKLSKAVPSPFDEAPLFRIEVEVDISDMDLALGILPDRVGGKIFDEEMLASLEPLWFELTAGPKPQFGAPALLYSGLYTNPLPIYAKGKLVGTRSAKVLNSTITLNNFLTITANSLARLLQQGDAEHLAVYDVGQGNCNGLLDQDYMPTIYFDLGAGVFRNAKTTPFPLKFCFTHNPPIVLSHWDTDHWAGAFATSVNGKYPALDQEWVAPSQQITILHYVFALEILNQNGNIRIYRGSGVHRTAATAKGNVFEFWTGMGNDRNGTGIVLNVEEQATLKSWLLTGDCDYVHFPPRPTALTPVAIVAPHHGAKVSNPTAIPNPHSMAPSSYKRLVYSFGPNNSHGRHSVSHPRQAAVLDHELAGWIHNSGYLAIPGSSTYGGPDVRGTSEHATAPMRGGVLVGWNLPVAPMTPPCLLARCSDAPMT